MTYSLSIKNLSLLIMFWNLQNYYVHDYKKSNSIASTIALCADKFNGSFPHILSFCEIENKETLLNLTSKTLLSQLSYTILHKDSPDKRGIDCALLYKSSHLTLLSVKYIQPTLNSKSLNTRDIIYAKFCILNTGDTLHLFVNHWPSQLGGAKKTAPKREAVKKIINHYTDSISIKSPLNLIIVCGDFNTPQPNLNLTAPAPLNLFPDKPYNVSGTYKHKGEWEFLDHFFCHTPPNLESASYVFSAPHLFLPDTKYLGVKPKATFVGKKYIGGISDHLPITLAIFSYFCKNSKN